MKFLERTLDAEIELGLDWVEATIGVRVPQMRTTLSDCKALVSTITVV